ERDAAALGLDHFAVDRRAAAVRRPADGDGAGARELKVLRAVLGAESMARNDDRLVPMRYESRHVAADDRLPENRPVEDVADRPVRRLPHLLEPEFLDPGFVGRDRRALHGDAVLTRGVGRIDRDLI